MIPIDPIKALEDGIKTLRPDFPESVVQLLRDAEGAAKLVEQLPHHLSPINVSVEHSGGQRIWELFGIYYFRHHRYHEAALLFSGLYDHLLLFQETEGKRCHKGVPLFWFGQCHWGLGNKVIAKRYVMLSLCEDAVKDGGVINTQESGSYWKLAGDFGMAREQVNKYISDGYDLCKNDELRTRFPEWTLQHLNQEWMVEIPSTSESGLYIVSHPYARWLVSKTGDPKGEYLEYLAQYLIGAMPGCRSFRRVSTKVSEFDVIGALEGVFADFRSELGRYILAECKDWDRTANFTTVAKYCRVLDSAKCRLGILFSRNGVSGTDETLFAEREILRVFHSNGIVIVVVTKNDLDEIARGRNFLSMIRGKYEMVRFDLRGELGLDPRSSEK